MAVVADYLARIVKDQDRPEKLPDPLPLEEPTEPEWAVGTIGVSYDEAEDRIVLVVEEQVDEGETGAIARLSVTRSRRPRSPSRPPGWSSRGGRRARSAAHRSTHQDTSAHGPTATGRRWCDGVEPGDRL